MNRERMLEILKGAKNLASYRPIINYEEALNAYKDCDSEKFKAICRGNFVWWGKRFLVGWDELGDGFGLIYYKNGKLLEKEYYINGKRYGVSERYYMNGNLDYRAHYIDDKLYGTFLTYDEHSGRLMGMENYVNEKLYGHCKYYNNNSKLKIEGNYISNKHWGEWIYYDAYGSIQDKKYFINGVEQ